MSDGTITSEKSGFSVTLHPAFASRMVILRDDGEVEVYRQRKPYNLAGGGRPRRHRIRLSGGSSHYDLTLDIDDPNHRIARITIELFGEDHMAGIGARRQIHESIVVEGDALTCPPVCDAI